MRRTPWTTRQIDLDFLEASEKFDYKKAEQLFAEGADINAVGKEVGGTALIMAFRQGISRKTSIRWARWLLEHGADPNIIDPEGEHAMYYAVHEGVEGMRLILDHGGDPNLSAEADGSDALDHAALDSMAESSVRNEYDDVYDLLVGAGATIPEAKE
ncbi:MAG: ankyrin repeat domain-containing protein [Pseudodesulfovibrio sp.]|nr:ankyrin repeat domain-containing protein [Pseudodesulfovibrio sp.]